MQTICCILRTHGLAFLKSLSIRMHALNKPATSPVVSFEVRYGEPLRYGDVAIVRTWVSESRGTKTTYSYEVFKQGDDVEVAKPCVTGTSTHCLVDSNTFKPVSIKRTLPELFDLYEQVCER